MNKTDRGPREVALPAAAFAALGDALRAQAGPLAAIHGLHAAGYGAGESFYHGLSRSLHGPAAAIEEAPERTFWSSFTAFLQKRGWGTLRHSSPHPGVGMLSSSDWAEAEGVEASQPSCAFSVGLLSHLLTRVATDPVAVLEVACRAAGHDSCAFAFGSETTIHDLYGLLLEGKGIEQALAEL